MGQPVSCSRSQQQREKYLKMQVYPKKILLRVELLSESSSLAGATKFAQYEEKSQGFFPID